MVDFSVLLICKFRQYKVVNIANFVYYEKTRIIRHLNFKYVPFHTYKNIFKYIKIIVIIFICPDPHAVRSVKCVLNVYQNLRFTHIVGRSDRISFWRKNVHIRKIKLLGQLHKSINLFLKHIKRVQQTSHFYISDMPIAVGIMKSKQQNQTFINSFSGKYVRTGHKKQECRCWHQSLYHVKILFPPGVTFCYWTFFLFSHSKASDANIGIIANFV